MKIFLKDKYDITLMLIKHKKSKIGVLMWIILSLLLGFTIMWAMYKSGAFSNKTFADLVSKINPFA